MYLHKTRVSRGFIFWLSRVRRVPLVIEFLGSLGISMQPIDKVREEKYLTILVMAYNGIWHIVPPYVIFISM